MHRIFVHAPNKEYMKCIEYLYMLQIKSIPNVRSPRLKMYDVSWKFDLWLIFESVWSPLHSLY